LKLDILLILKIEFTDQILILLESYIVLPFEILGLGEFELGKTQIILKDSHIILKPIDFALIKLNVIFGR
jgi:hypothetical protein